MKNKKFALIGALLVFVLLVGGCGINLTSSAETVGGDTTDTPESLAYDIMMYDNKGENFLNFEGNSFTISPNRVKQWGYNTDGSWESYYDTSSVVTIEVDGQYIQTCGSPVIFKDKKLEMLELPDEIQAQVRDAMINTLEEKNATVNGRPVSVHGT